MKIFRRLEFLFCLFFICGSEGGNILKAQNPVSWSFKSAKENVKAGNKFHAELSASIESGWHVYSITQKPGGPIPMSIAVEKGSPYRIVGRINGTLPHREMDANFGIVTETYEGKANFTIPLVASPNAAPGNRSLIIRIRFQACSEQACMPARTINLSAPVSIMAAGSANSANTQTLYSPTSRHSQKINAVKTPAAENLVVNKDLNNFNAIQSSGTDANIARDLLINTSYSSEKTETAYPEQKSDTHIPGSFLIPAILGVPLIVRHFKTKPK